MHEACGWFHTSMLIQADEPEQSPFGQENTGFTWGCPSAVFACLIKCPFSFTYAWKEPRVWLLLSSFVLTETGSMLPPPPLIRAINIWAAAVPCPHPSAAQYPGFSSNIWLSVSQCSLLLIFKLTISSVPVQLMRLIGRLSSQKQKPLPP